MAYCALSDVRTYLNKEVSDTADDALLTEMCDRATDIIDGMTQRTFAASADTTRYLDAVNDVSGRTLWLRGDLAQITSVVNGDGATVTAYVAEPRYSAPYYALRLKSQSGLLWTWSTDPEDAIAVTGRWAFSVTPPDAIVQAAVRLAVYLFRQKDNLGELDRAMVVGGNMTVLPQNLPRDIKLMLAPYMKRR